MTILLPHTDLSAIAPANAEGDPDRGIRNAAIIVTALFWLSSYAVLSSRDIFSPIGLTWVAAGVRAGVTLIGCGFCYLIHLLIKRLTGRPFHQRAIAVALLVPFVADGYSWVNYIAFGLVDPSSIAKTTTASTGAIIYAVVYWVWFFMAWSALYLALIYSGEVRAEERRSAAIQLLAHSAQLRALRYQVNPHFLFNTLNSISTLILDKRIEQADAMVSRLSDFFRASLTLDPLADVRLADEMALQKLYLEIEQVRFPDLSVEIRLPAELDDALVPSLILQPPVENAIKYAVAHSDSSAHVIIQARRDNEWLVLEVSDSGRANIETVKPGTGIGLDNVRGRLRARFGDVQWLQAGPIHPHGFRVGLGMPLRLAP